MISNRRGFTIVELLIVIVVISILAAISVVAYSGIQKNSRTTVIYANAKQLAKIVAIYGQQTGSLPNPGGCFGSLADYPATSVNELGYCWNISDGTNLYGMFNVYRTPTMNNLVSSIANVDSMKYDVINIIDTDGYKHAVRGYWFRGDFGSPVRVGTVSFAVPSAKCPGDSVEWAPNYYRNGNICSIDIRL